MKKAPEHSPYLFTVTEQKLIVGGKTLDELADELGQTPFYVYDKKLIQERIQLLRQNLPEKIKLHYAVKANPFAELLAFISPLVDGMDVASPAEMELAIAAGQSINNISFAGPGKTDKELQQAINAGITLNVESLNELQRIKQLCRDLAQKAYVAIRVNPDFELKSSGMTMAGGAKPFGIDSEQVPQVLEAMTDDSLVFRGLHIFWGSQNLNTDNIISAQQATFELARQLMKQSSLALKTLNIGGGFGIPYFPGDTPIDLARIKQALSQNMNSFTSTFPDTEVIIELGRFIVGEAGVYCSRVIDKKVSRGKTFVVVDGGMHHHLAASGNLGQVIRKNYPVLNASRVRDNPETQENVSIVGPLCTPLDILANNVSLPSPEIGDLIAVLQSGAYGASASPQGFLSHPAPIETLV